LGCEDGDGTVPEEAQVKNPISAIATFCSFTVTTPIWLILLYRVLSRTNAGELDWFLYWIYLPMHILIVILLAIVKVIEDEQGK
jgi:hypothetical protein